MAYQIVRRALIRRSMQFSHPCREALEVQTVALRRQALAREQRIAAELTAQATALQVMVWG
jgi:hypothetical protein